MKKDNNIYNIVSDKYGLKICKFDIKNPKIRYFISNSETECYVVFPDDSWAFYNTRHNDYNNKWVYRAFPEWRAFTKAYGSFKRISYKDVFIKIL